MEPLNPSLHEALRRRFGVVKISNDGMTAIVRSVPTPWVQNANGTRGTREEELDSGEYYRVNCPYCRDTKFRLYVNYRWNTLELNGKHRRIGKNLIYCFNEKCDMSNFPDQLKGYVIRSLRLGSVEPRKATDMFKEVPWPGRCVPLNALPIAHPAIQYVASPMKWDDTGRNIGGRGMDPTYLAKEWGVHFCLDAPHELVKGRIVIPVYWGGKMVGWQARAVGDVFAGPKYYTMPGLKKNFMLYNGDRAKTYRFGVVVEGFFDAFRVGTNAVALLGKSMSFYQRELALGYWGNGGMCVMLDPDAVEDMENLTKILNPQAFRWGAWSMVLPFMRDPSDFETQDLWRMIVSQARARNIPLAQI